MGLPLYESKRGERACAEHAPLQDLRRWRDEGWERVPADAARELYCHQCAARQPTPPARKPLILNVDDREPSLYARERTLRLRGFAVVNATTGAEAEAAVRRLLPSIVLLDVHLPDADGRDVCRVLKDDPQLRSIPVVLISATVASHVTTLEALRWGRCDAYLREPVDPERLESTLRALLPAAA